MSETEKIFWDLDGTLINVRPRLYRLFAELTGMTLSYGEYWRLKDKGLNQQQMLGFVGFHEYSAAEFKARWLANVERADLLKLDSLFEEVKDMLALFKKRGIKMYVVTNRQSVNNLRKQLTELGVSDYLNGMISTLQRCTKAEAVRNAGLDVSKAVFVGDSLEDMQAAAELAIPKVLIVRNDVGKSKIEADFYIKNLRGLENIILF